MPLSISNSNERIPDAPWGKMWTLVLVVGIVLLGAWEGFWRWQGFSPSLIDESGLWVQMRKKVKSNDPRSVVLIGASRIQLGLNTKVFAQMTGITPIQLAMNGEVPLMLLRHFAQDSSFRGIIISDMNEEWVWTEAEAEGRKPTEWLRAYETQTWSAQVEQWLKGGMQGLVVFRLPDIAPHNVWKAFRVGYWPAPSYVTMLSDRSVLADYTKLDSALIRQKDETYRTMSRTPPWSPEEYRARSRTIGAFVTPIIARGGKVIFLRFPTSGVLWELEEQRYPRKDYWDVFAAESQAVTIHFKDYPTLAHFNCPDGSHLDYRDAVPFTKALVEILAPLLN